MVISSLFDEPRNCPAAHIIAAVDLCKHLVAAVAADGSQTLDLQRDALLAAGVEPGHLYEDQASGKRDNRPGLEALTCRFYSWS
jgi:hypothetical protein